MSGAEEEGVWVEDREWVGLAEPTVWHRCRWMTNRRQCYEPAVAKLLRGTKKRTWYFYCSEHLYGRRWVGGKVWVRVHPKSLAGQTRDQVALP